MPHLLAHGASAFAISYKGLPRFSRHLIANKGYVGAMRYLKLDPYVAQRVEKLWRNNSLATSVFLISCKNIKTFHLIEQEIIYYVNCLVCEMEFYILRCNDICRLPYFTYFTLMLKPY